MMMRWLSFTSLRPAKVGACLALAALLLSGPTADFALAQKQNPPASKEPAKRASKPARDEAERQLAQRMQGAGQQPAAPANRDAVRPAIEAGEPPNLFKLWWDGGPIMYPITAMSFMVVLFACERWLGLRRRRVIPRRLVRELNELAARPGGLDPREAFRLCKQYPSTASSVLSAVLAKIGRPQFELERAMTDASEREAARLWKNVRPITLSTSVAPLLGLLGTVAGIIHCFFTTASLPPGANKTQWLAAGIYMALVSTFGGLAVAIPSAVLAHYFEGRIQARFRQIDDLLLGLIPQLERFEGKVRVARGPGDHAEGQPRPAAEPATKRQPVTGG